MRRYGSLIKINPSGFYEHAYVWHHCIEFANESKIASCTNLHIAFIYKENCRLYLNLLVNLVAFRINSFFYSQNSKLHIYIGNMLIYVMLN